VPVEEEEEEELRKFHIEELHYFHSSDTLKVMKPRRNETGETWKR
jgi:hypothetical protein